MPRPHALSSSVRVMMFMMSGGHSAQLWIVAERFQGVLVRRVGSMRQLRRFFWTLRSSQNWSQVSELCFVPKGGSLGRSPLHCCGPSSSLVFSHLPVWPSFRLPWPSTRKLLEGRWGDEGTRWSLLQPGFVGDAVSVGFGSGASGPAPY